MNVAAKNALAQNANIPFKAPETLSGAKLNLFWYLSAGKKFEWLKMAFMSVFFARENLWVRFSSFFVFLRLPFIPDITVWHLSGSAKAGRLATDLFFAGFHQR
ncbi:MAG: hypothetical protein J7L19_00120 [Dehalococcoidia bacterium]|nr:hypothetical protein [Dehalococcoidia bacterium]